MASVLFFLFFFFITAIKLLESYLRKPVFFTSPFVPPSVLLVQRQAQAEEAKKEHSAFF